MVNNLKRLPTIFVSVWEKFTCGSRGCLAIDVGALVCLFNWK